MPLTVSSCICHDTVEYVIFELLFRVTVRWLFPVATMSRRRRGVLFHQNNAPPQRSSQARLASIKNPGSELRCHRPYSLDLAPIYFYLYPKLKEYYEDENLLMMRTLYARQVAVRKTNNNNFSKQNVFNRHSCIRLNKPINQRTEFCRVT